MTLFTIYIIHAKLAVNLYMVIHIGQFFGHNVGTGGRLL